MNKRTIYVAGALIATLVVDEIVNSGHHLFREHTHIDYTHLATNYSVSPVIISTASGDAAII